MTTTAPAPAAPPPSTPQPERPAGGRRRLTAMIIWSAGFAVCMKLIGLPTDPVYAFGCLWAATIAWNSHRPWRYHLRFLRDWIAVVLLLVAYNFSRGFADNGVTPHALELIAFDRAVFGEVPTLWLQHHLYDPAHLRWYDIVASIVYFSHFVTALIVAVVLWLRNRERWAAFVRRWFFLCAIGLATYFAYPAAPPWWAARYGLLDPVARISTRGWTALGQHSAGNMLNVLQKDAANPVAAMPSLHSAFALLVVVFFLPSVRRRWWPLLLAYPLAMTFTLVYCGEHYMLDVFVGWAYVGIAFLVVGLAERLWRRYRPATAPPAAAPPAPVPPEPGSVDRVDLAEEPARLEKLGQ
jgi:membrane-associated phospholipid phosphatase